MTTPPRPTFEEMLHRIDTVLDENDQHAATVHQDAVSYADDQLARLEWPNPEPSRPSRGLLARAIGWFRR